MKRIVLLSIVLITGVLLPGVAANFHHNSVTQIPEKMRQMINMDVKPLLGQVKYGQFSKLDSVVHNDGSRKLLQYNNRGDLTDYKFISNTVTGSLELIEHAIFEYDGNGNQTLYILSRLVGTKMTDIEKTVNHWDLHGRILSSVNWIENNGTLLLNSKTELSYNGDEMITSDYDWDTEAVDWLKVSYMITKLNAERLAIEMDIYDKSEDTGEWFLSQKISMHYNTEGQETQVVLNSLDVESGDWIIAMTIDYEYYESGSVKLERTSFIMGESLIVLDETRYEYNPQNKLVRKGNYINPLTGGELTVQSQTDYVYTNELLSEQTESVIDHKTIQLVANYKFLFEYDKKVAVTNMSLPNNGVDNQEVSDFFSSDYYDEAAIKKVTHYQKNYQSGEFDFVRTVDYYYSLGEGTTKVPLFHEAIAYIGPNPFDVTLSISTRIQSGKLAIYTLNGSLLFQSPLSGNSIIYPGIMDRGIYILEITENDKIVFRTKIIRK